jgi:ribosome-associated translation inhibitor RaiA
MRIEVRGKAAEPGQDVRNYVGLRLMSVLDHQVRRVEGVAVTLTPARLETGPAGTRCRMLALLRPTGSAIVDTTDADLYAAIDGAAERLARVVESELSSRSEAPPLGAAALSRG